MNMNFFHARDKIRRASFYIPFTVYFVAFFVAAFIAFRAASNNEIDTYSSYSDIFSLLLKVAIAFCGAIILIAFLSVLVSYLYFIYHKKKKGIYFEIATEIKETDLKQKQSIKLIIRPVLKPFFGFLKLRLLYDKKQYSEKFSLVENKGGRFFNTSIEGTYNWPLPQIKEYHVEKGLVYFEDIFQFFSFAVTLPASSHFFTQPSSKPVADLKVAPRKTEHTTTRIEELRKVEGEYLNYKNFENNDDVRRIVWKIYAKNKELVVRIPEIMDPYASHLYLYASFFSHFNIEGNAAAEIPFLNYYKVLIWSVYQNLVKRGFEVRYIPDQQMNKNNMADEQQSVKYMISTSSWHRVTDLKSYVKSNDASVIVISSLSDANEVKQFIELHGKDITFIFIKLTDAFKNQNMIDWVQWIFVQNAKEDMDVYKRGWSLSPLRVRIKENERLLTDIVEKYQEEKV
jgi:cbb3-type cytochrome oxidase subunit 3